MFSLGVPCPARGSRNPLEPLAEACRRRRAVADGFTQPSAGAVGFRSVGRRKQRLPRQNRDVAMEIGDHPSKGLVDMNLHLNDVRQMLHEKVIGMWNLSGREGDSFANGVAEF